MHNSIGKIYTDFDPINRIEFGYHSKIREAFNIVKKIGKTTNFFMYGSAVRNLLLGKDLECSDFDFIGAFDLEAIAKEYDHLIVGRRSYCSTLKLKIGSNIFDLTYSSDIVNSLKNNDIDTSQFLLDELGTCFDIVGGLRYLQDRIINITNPREKILADTTRIRRVLNQSFDLGFDISYPTKKVIVDYVNYIIDVSFFDYKQKKMGFVCHENKRQIDNSYRNIGKSIDLQSSEIRKNTHFGGRDDKSYAVSDIQVTNNGELLFKIKNGIEIMTKISFNNQVDDKVDLFTYKTVGLVDQIDSIFKNVSFYFIGGALRDIVNGKNPKDFDIKIDLSVDQIKGLLKDAGYIKTSNLILSTNEYYYNTKFDVFSINLNGIDVDISSSNSTHPAQFTENGDLTINGLVFDPKKGVLYNSQYISDIENYNISYLNFEKLDSSKIISSLKHISKNILVTIDNKVHESILNNTNTIAQTLVENDLLYKIYSVIGNSNSSQVYSYFGGQQEFEKFFGLKISESNITIKNSNTIVIKPIDLTESQKRDISNLASQGYGNNYSQTKLNFNNYDSIVLRYGAFGLMSFVGIKKYRIYSIAAINGDEWIKLLSDIYENNSFIRAKVDLQNTKIMNYCALGGMRAVENIDYCKKILNYYKFDGYFEQNYSCQHDVDLGLYLKSVTDNRCFKIFI